MALGQAAQNRLECRARHLGLDTAQHVVGAEFNDDCVGVIRHRPVEPGERVRGRVAGDAGIGDLCRDTLARQRRLQASDEAILLGQAEPCRDQVAERHDLEHFSAADSGRSRYRHKRSATNRRGDRPAQDLAHNSPPPI